MRAAMPTGDALDRFLMARGELRRAERALDRVRHSRATDKGGSRVRYSQWLDRSRENVEIAGLCDDVAAAVLDRPYAEESRFPQEMQ